MRLARPEDRGMSSVVGEILMVGVVVIVVSVAGSFVLGNAMEEATEERERLLEASIAHDGEVVLSHRGGDSIDATEMRLVVVNDSGETWTAGFESGTPDGSADGSFDVGDVVRFDSAAIPTGAIEVHLVHDPTEAVLESARFS